MKSIKRALKEKSMVKIIAGIDNFDVEQTRKVVIAANLGGADAVDISASPEIIRMAKEISNIPVFVSSIKPQELKRALELGADAIEIGNFDAMYKEGKRVSAEEVLEITRRTIELVGKNAFLSVTIPGHIEVSEQIALAEELATMGVNIIQTEGAATVSPENSGARGLLEKANVSIANTIELVKNVEIPVMTASGISATTAPMAFAAGASAIGIGSAVNKLSSEIEMIAAVKSITEAVKARKGLLV